MNESTPAFGQGTDTPIVPPDSEADYDQMLRTVEAEITESDRVVLQDLRVRMRNRCNDRRRMSRVGAGDLAVLINTTL